MARAKIVRDQQGLFYGIRWICPGCEADARGSGVHILPVSWLPPGETQESPHVAGKPHWTFNGDMELPVFGPSVLSSWDEHDDDDKVINKHICHSFIGINGAPPGHIIFLADCTHPLVGKVMPLPNLKPSQPDLTTV
jgi:hypothetical protein